MSHLLCLAQPLITATILAVLASSALASGRALQLDWTFVGPALQ